MLYLDSNNCLFIHTLSKKPSELIKQDKRCGQLLRIIDLIDQSAHRQSFIAIAFQ